MTPRQQRRLEQKLARKAAKKACKSDASTCETPDAIDTTPAPISLTSSASLTEPRAQASGCISEAKLIANRANSRLSHGPVTATGKEKVGQNATRHGLTGQFHVLPNESQGDFDELLAGYMLAETPFDDEEVELVKQMAQATWLSSRSVRMQNEAFLALETGTPEEQKEAKKDLSLYLRYMTTHDRVFDRCSAELRKRRNERRRVERGFVSQKLCEAAEARREANENRKKEMHELRQAIANCRRERLEIQNRAAEFKAERAKTIAAAA